MSAAASLTLLVAIVVVPAQSHRICTEATECTDAGGTRLGLRIRGQPYQVRFTWRVGADRVIAALLLRALGADYCRLALCEALRGPCALEQETHPEYIKYAAAVGVEQLEGTECADFDVVPQTRAPPLVSVRLHVRLGATALRNPSCAAAASMRFYAEPTSELLRACGFSVPTQRLIPDDVDLPHDHGKYTRAALVKLIENKSANESFLFYDYQLWDDHESVGVVRDASRVEEAESAPLRGRFIQLQMHAPEMVRALRNYTVNGRVVRDLLAIEESLRPEQPDASPSQLAILAVDSWASSSSAGNESLLDVLRKEEELRRGGGGGGKGLASLTVYYVYAYLCENDTELDTFLEYIMSILLARTKDDHIGVQLKQKPINCLDRDELRQHELESVVRDSTSYRLLGAAVVGAGVSAAYDHAAEELHIPLLAYDAQPDGKRALTSTARPDALADALLDALAACSWQSAALISESSPTARDVADRMRRSERLVPSAEETLPLGASVDALSGTLRSLYAQGARVFVINASGPTARAVLEAAAKLHVTELEGCAWVAREWSGPRAPPLPLLALRVGNDSDIPRVAWNLTQGKLNLTFAWMPPHFTPLAKALVALGTTFMRLLKDDPESRFDHRTAATYKLFRENLRTDPILNVSAMPRVRFEWWNGSGAEPQYYEGQSVGCRTPGVRHGYSPCDVRLGERCLDTLVLVGALALIFAASVAGYGAAALRRRAHAAALTRRRRERASAAAALLVRQKDAVATLLPWLVEREEVRLVRELGSGRFGRVWLAALGADGRGGFAAAKAPHSGCAPAEEGELLREAAALAPLRHDHVVRLVGVCLSAGPPLVLTEPAFFGDLLRYLRVRRSLALSDTEAGEAAHVSAAALTRMAREAALALAYLAERGLVHRDVRAANCLVDERRSLKLADFGMTRATAGGDGEYACRRRALFPVLWMAPESLARGIFSHASDVWALGVLALELATLGARPFGGMEAHAAVRLVRSGGHAPVPRSASAHTARLTGACWRRTASTRPVASAVAAWLAERPRALSPCRADHEYDADSGFAEPEPHHAAPDPAR